MPDASDVGHLGGSVVPLYFEEYQEVRQALAMAEGGLSAVLATQRSRKRPDLSVVGLTHLRDVLQEASATLACAYTRKLDKEVADAER